LSKTVDTRVYECISISFLHKTTRNIYFWLLPLGLEYVGFFIEAEVEKLPLQLELLCLQGCRCLCLMLCVCGCLVCPEV